jgi:hypothetical protein
MINDIATAVNRARKSLTDSRKNQSCNQLIPAKAGIQFDRFIFVHYSFPFKGKDGKGMGLQGEGWDGCLDAPVSSTGQAPQVMHDEFKKVKPEQWRCQPYRITSAVNE